ncbi:hypothetical protein BVRB_5g118210 [Beta vulgaris subsp. vulgaris]|nr:hypothetical protein BVRB_5g118210 [Beta vulgaris subsp. vulgaris]
MDADFWASRINSSKNPSAHISSGNRLVLDDSEVKDDARTYFTCPFCYVDIELATLCDHLQAEHCFDVKNAVCPVCALNLGKDVVGHFKTHHMNSIKTRRRSQKSGFWNFYAGRMIGGMTAKGGSENVNALAPDPLLSPFLCSILCSDSRDDQSQDMCSIDDTSSIPKTESSKPSMLNHIQEKEDSEELRQRTEFCQQLLYSTIF